MLTCPLMYSCSLKIDLSNNPCILDKYSNIYGSPVSIDFDGL